MEGRQLKDGSGPARGVANLARGLQVLSILEEL